MEQLARNPYVKSVSTKGITYKDEFKQLFREIFKTCGFEVHTLGMTRVKAAARRWKASYNKQGVSGLQDTRGQHFSRPLKRELTLAEKNVKLEAQIQLLRDENELL